MASFLDSFPFSIFVLSVLSTKFLHLFVQASSIPVLSFIFYSPSFLVPDVIFISIARILLRRDRGILALVGYTFAIAITWVDPTSRRLRNAYTDLIT